MTGVVIPTGNQDYALAASIGAGGNYADTFQGSVENITSDDFDADGISRSDLYELAPGTIAAGTYNTPGRYLGYFELKPDGTLTFNTTAAPLPAPAITAIARSGGVTTVSFTTVANATYSLLSVGAEGVISPVSGWAQGASVSGDGGVLTLQDSNSADVRFYSIKVQRP